MKNRKKNILTTSTPEVWVNGPTFGVKRFKRRNAKISTTERLDLIKKKHQNMLKKRAEIFFEDFWETLETIVFFPES